MLPFDLTRARQETPGCQHHIHFNNAGAALMPTPVVQATVDYLQLETEQGGYETAEQKQDQLGQIYDTVSNLLNCQSEEIALMENATRAWDMAFYGIPFQAGDRILTGMAEYGSNYIAFLQIAQKRGVVIDVIPNDEHGQVSVAALRSMIDERVKLIAITHVPTNSGLINPVAEIGRIARQANILYLVDACQSVGQMPIDVNQIGCDMLSATGRKFLRGPRGTGFLYVRQTILDQLQPPFLDIRSATWTSRDAYTMRPDARRFETWEANWAARIGLGTAVAYALDWGLEAIWARIQKLANHLRRELASIPGVSLHDTGQHLCGIVAFTLAGQSPTATKERLAQQGIAVSVSGITSTRLDMAARGLEQVVRASVHYYNSEDEIDRFCLAIRTHLTQP